MCGYRRGDRMIPRRILSQDGDKVEGEPSAGWRL